MVSPAIVFAEMKPIGTYKRSLDEVLGTRMYSEDGCLSSANKNGVNARFFVCPFLLFKRNARTASIRFITDGIVLISFGGQSFNHKQYLGRLLIKSLGLKYGQMYFSASGSFLMSVLRSSGERIKFPPSVANDPTDIGGTSHNGVLLSAIIIFSSSTKYALIFVDGIFTAPS